MKGEKMSKSLGNGLSMRELYEQYESYYAIRFMLTSVNYRSMLEYDDSMMQLALSFKSKLTIIMNKTLKALSNSVNEGNSADNSNAHADSRYDLHVNENMIVKYDDLPVAFKDALNDDFNVSLAISIIHQHLNTLTSMLTVNYADDNDNASMNADDTGHAIPLTDVYSEYLTIRRMLSVLSLDLLSHDWFNEYDAVNSNHADAMTSDVNGIGIMHGNDDSDGFISALNEIRRVMRVNHDYNYADMLRDVMNKHGYQVNDAHVS